MSVERRVRVEVTALAEKDAEAIVVQMIHEQPDAAYRFIAAVESTRDLLAMFPNAGRAFEQRPLRAMRLRRYSIPGFRNYLVLYIIRDDRVIIAGIVHGARNLAAEIGDWPSERLSP